MSGALGLLTIIFGMWDTYFNYCDTGCFAKSETQAYNSISYGKALQRRNLIGSEMYFRRDTSRMSGPFQLTYGLSVTNTLDIWAGAGVKYRVPLEFDNFYVDISAMVGLYAQGDGAQLGGPIEFRSGIEAGYQAENGIRYAVLADHRSSAFIYGDSPGLETFQFQVSIPLK